MSNVKYFIKNPSKIPIPLLTRYCAWMPDKLYLKVLYRALMGRPLNLKSPKLFSEKLQWLKIYDRKPIYHLMVDKVESKKLINNILGGGYTVPTLGIFDSFEEIRWDNLPNSFILKATHDSGSYYIVKDKEKLNKQECKKQLYKHWNKDFYLMNREWQYKGLKPRIIVEPLIATPKMLREYKFFCFNGEPKFYQTCYDRNNALGGAILNFYDLEGRKMDLQDASHSRHSEVEMPRPINLQKMIDFSKSLSSDTIFLRVDFFEVEEQLFVGELTLEEGGGFCEFTPNQWNEILGCWIKLPIDK